MTTSRERRSKQEKLVRTLAERLRFELLLLNRYREREAASQHATSDAAVHPTLAHVLAAAVAREADAALAETAGERPVPLRP